MRFGPWLGRAFLGAAASFAIVGGIAAPDASGISSTAPLCLAVPSIDERCEVWVDSFDSPGDGRWGEDSVSGMAVSPTGDGVFVTGGSYPETASWTESDALTVAYDGATGARRWIDRFDGDERATDYAWAIASSPNGERLFVTGFTDLRENNEAHPSCGSFADCTTSEYFLVAYDQSSGERLWIARYDGSDLFGHGLNEAKDVTTSADGSQVFVTGSSCPTPGLVFVGDVPASCDYVTVAYDATTGTELWRARSNPDRVNEYAFWVEASPDGEAVYVSGWARQAPGVGETDFFTIAYDAAGPDSGQTLWSDRYDGGVRGTDVPYAMALAPDGGRLFVAGAAQGQTGNDCALVAYDTGSGYRPWVSLHRGPANNYDACNASAVVATDDRVFAAGTVTVVDSILPPDSDHVATALDATNGEILWHSVYGFPNATVEGATSLGVSDDGRDVFVTGYSSELYHAESSDFATHAHDASSGQRAWVGRYSPQDGRTGGIDVHVPVVLAAAPNGARIYVAGSFGYRPDLQTLPQGSLGSGDVGVAAYAAP